MIDCRLVYGASAAAHCFFFRFIFSIKEQQAFRILNQQVEPRSLVDLLIEHLPIHSLLESTVRKSSRYLWAPSTGQLAALFAMAIPISILEEHAN